MGGIATGSIAAGRRTQSSYPRFLASTNPSDLNVSYFGANSGPTAASPYSASLTNEIAHLPHVRRVRSLLVPTVNPLAANGGPDVNLGAQLATGGSVDGLLSNQDRVTVIHG